ncbi:C-terminal binding protein [Aquibacillus sp. 3ASR75-11]|uniref:C-terminal binding protein n=1 Tax=Terrihalobacillus insolitus TaxID=2950438 RepID=A0A9X3WTL9_9BACI|nr:C-terminal binding protein [Terrihalobacillus insolitus]MDC3412197.1 C-terminal binding protein [Terrihalobacillus insolitus]MDC3423109.1 C-terminal binding protein [Terrihalobacillus insolitus]
MNKYKVVVTDYEYETLALEIKVLEAAGAQLVATQCRTENEIIEAVKDADGIITQYAPISRKVIESLSNCKVISRYGIGFDAIDVKAATEKGILVSNVTDYCLDEVADHAFALLMASARKVVQLNQAVKNGNWDFKIGAPIYRLKGRTLGLIGLGNIPQSLAKKAQAFGLEVIAFDPFVSEAVAQKWNVTLVDLDTLCEQSDFVSVHAPLNEHTQGMVSDQQFSKMKQEAFIINTARGPIIDQNALIRALQQQEIAGAALDVVETEPIAKDNPLVTMDNVILNPHTAWYSEESMLELKQKVAQNVADVLSGFFPSYVVNKDLLETLNLQTKS